MGFQSSRALALGLIFFVVCPNRPRAYIPATRFISSYLLIRKRTRGPQRAAWAETRDTKRNPKGKTTPARGACGTISH